MSDHMNRPNQKPNDPLDALEQRRKQKIEQFQLNLDGEFGGNLPADFQILESHLCVYAPKSVDRLLQELMN